MELLERFFFVPGLFRGHSTEVVTENSESVSLCVRVCVKEEELTSKISEFSPESITLLSLLGRSGSWENRHVTFQVSSHIKIPLTLFPQKDSQMCLLPRNRRRLLLPVRGVAGASPRASSSISVAAVKVVVVVVVVVVFPFSKASPVSFWHAMTMGRRSGGLFLLLVWWSCLAVPSLVPIPTQERTRTHTLAVQSNDEHDEDV